jgi:hypothetical protein
MRASEDFNGQGEVLLTEPLRAFRAWSLNVEIMGRDQARLTHDQERAAAYPWFGSTCSRTSRTSRLNEGGTVSDGDPRGGKNVPIPRSDDEIVRMTLNPVNQRRGARWERTCTATCLVHEGVFPWTNHPVPADDCTCGIYSWYRRDEAIREHTGIIVGVISVSGRVILGTRGIRSSEARIEAITINDDLGSLVPFSRRTMMRALRRETLPGRLYDGVEVLDSVRDLDRRYPPDLDTLGNVLGPDLMDDLCFDGAHPALGGGTARTGVHLVAGARVQRAVSGLKRTLDGWRGHDE